MLKKYQSKTSISLSVLMNTGKSVHVSFDSITGGGSVFYTDDEELQEALAKHHKYGRLFKEAELMKPVAAPTPAVKEEENINDVEDTEEEVDEAENEAPEDNGEEVQEQEAPVATGKQIHVTDLEDAKNYLADNFGVSRTKTRSKKAIVEAAEANGIVFVGI